MQHCTYTALPKYTLCIHFLCSHYGLTPTGMCRHEARTFTFVGEPDRDYICPVCQDLLTKPFQLDCGHHLCRKYQDCLLKINKSECPVCRKFNAFNGARLNRYLQRKVNSVKVHCHHHKEGCEWVGEVRYLQDHLDHNVISCPFGCGKYSCEVAIKRHKSLHCHNRPIKCKNYNYYNTFIIVTEKHYPICPQSTIDCPNYCHVQDLKRHQLQQHLSECSHQLVDCPNTGCSVRLPHGDMKLHKLHVQHHISQAPLATHFLYNRPPIEFVIPNITENKVAKVEWNSHSLFTHKRGYHNLLSLD